jgi:hypothetical protein
MRKKEGLGYLSQALVFFIGSGAWIRTRDLRVMSPTSYQTAPPRIKNEFELIAFQFVPVKGYFQISKGWLCQAPKNFLKGADLGW